MGHPVNWFQISGTNGKKLGAFYKKVFGWKVNPSPDGTMNMVDQEPGGIAGGIGTAQMGGPNVTVYVGVSDVVAMLDTITKAGGKKAMDPMDLPQGMGAIAGFTDPDGIWIGLWQSEPLKGGTASGPTSEKPKSAKPKSEKSTAAKKEAPAKAEAPASKSAAKAAPKSAPASSKAAAKGAPASSKAAPKSAPASSKSAAKSAPASAKTAPKSAPASAKTAPKSAPAKEAAKKAAAPTKGAEPTKAEGKGKGSVKAPASKAPASKKPSKK